MIENAPVVGCIGGGQLGRMLALAAAPLGVVVRCLDPSADACAGDVCELIVGAYDDPEALDRLADGADCVTYEFENVPAAALAALRDRTHVRPGAGSLTISQDRLWEKQLFGRVGVPCAAFGDIDTPDQLDDALARTGLPAVIKTKRMGYDGKGQRVVRAAEEARSAVADLGDELIAETLIDFRRELSLVLVRSVDRETVFYPLVENVHVDGILSTTVAPAPEIDPALQTTCEGYGRAVADALDHVGVLCLELFQTDQGVLANEFAPRVHNSGHWTIEGAETSQFENHLRAVLGLPLGSTAPRGASLMRNLVGEHPPLPELLVTGGHVHLYGKEPRPGRKLGHVTHVGASPVICNDLREWIDLLRSSGELAEVDAEVDPYLEITEIADRTMKGGGPALLFRNVRGSRHPLLINQFGTERRMCLALGVDAARRRRGEARGRARADAAAGDRRQAPRPREAQEPRRLVAEDRLARAVPGDRARPARPRPAADHDVLAVRRRPVHHPALGDHEGPADGRPQRRHVPAAQVRRPDDRPALADPQGRGRGLARGRRAHGGRDRARNRSDHGLLRLRAAAEARRRAHARRVPARASRSSSCSARPSTCRCPRRPRS